MRHRRRRTAYALTVLSIATLTGVSVMGPSPTRDTASASSEPLLMIGKAHPAESFPAAGGKKPIFVLVLGSDSRSKQWPVIQHGRSDVMHVVGINPKKGCATMLGFPRDSWVNVAGHGTTKINEAMYFDGPQGAITEIETLTGIHLDYWALTSFWNFKSLVHDLGGVDVVVPYPMDDPYSKAHFKEGKQHMSGYEALAFARDRHDPPTGDFGRSFNQGTLLLSLLTDFQQAFKQNPASMLDWLGAGIRNTETDVPYDELVQLGFLATEVPVSRVTNFVVPGTTGMVGDASVVHISPSAESMYEELGADGCIAGEKT
jgi:LCP family protein required for cell wall assembly